MSLKGSLEDVSVVDVIQFIYIGGRTGTLNIKAGATEALLGFSRGRITNAWRTGAPRLGELLIAAGALDQPTLEEALIMQEQEHPRRSIGQVLIGMNAVSPDMVHEALCRHFGWLVKDIVTWARGTFEFVLDDVWPVEELAAFPGDVTPKVELDTQTILLEALSFLDEMKKSGDRLPPAGDVYSPPLLADALITEATLDPPSAEPLPATAPPISSSELRNPMANSATMTAVPAVPHVQVVTTDTGLADRLRDVMKTDNARVSAVPAREAGSNLPGEPPPVVVVDMRGSSLGVESIRQLRRMRPRASVVAYCFPQTALDRVYEAGATAAVHGDDAALGACVESVFRNRLELSNEQLVADGVREGFARLRRIVAELRSGLLSTTVSLNLMNAVAESLERAIMFVIQQDQLIPLGSFGLGVPGQKPSEATRDLQMSLRERSVFSECVESGRARLVAWDDANLPEIFKQVVSRPRSGEIAVLPVAGSQRAIAAIYVDNGNKDRPIADVQVLELATFQLGLALENEFLRRARDTSRSSPPLRKVG
jgi:hypothetical protein